MFAGYVLALQWGRGFLAAERDHLFLGTHLENMASMGPRLFSRGKFLGRRSDALLQIKLQWGRGFLAAESDLNVTVLTAWMVLQWGRGFLAAERLTGPAPLLSYGGFNGAAAF